MKRIHVIGQGGSGKTSLAAEISARLKLPHTELDSIFWHENWQPSPPGVFEAEIEGIVAGDRWVLDGNYSRTRQLIWKRVDTVVWLDFPASEVWVGAVIIIGCGLYVIHRESLHHKS